MSYQSEAGKGSRQRPVDKKKFDENFDKIFGKKSPCETGGSCTQKCMECVVDEDNKQKHS